MSKPLLFSLFFILFSLSVFSLYRTYTTASIVYVDSTKLLNNYKGMIDARGVYQKKVTIWKANIDTLTVEVQNSIKKYEKESAGMSNKEKELSHELIKSKQKQLMDYQRAMNEKASEEDNTMTTQVLTQVNAYIKKFGKDKGYQIIMAATDYGNVAYAVESLDITDEVLEGLNKSYTGQ